MTSWEEIKKLAADLHRVQLGDSVKKLSDRNCIEIVTKLITDSLIDVVHTVDGKEYVTKDYLRTQIRNETVGNGGRIALTDLQQILNVQFHHIEERANGIVDVDTSFTLCLGQLITTDYLDNLADDVEAKLRDDGGRLTLGQLTKSYDLPTEFLKTEILKRLDADDDQKQHLQQRGRIRARADARSADGQVIFYTHAYVEEQRSRIRGAISALTRVMPISKLIAEINVETALFFKTFDQLVESGEIHGTLVGGRNVERAVYVPNIYTSRTNTYLKDFFYQNGYLEYSVIKKLSVTDVDQCLSRLFDEPTQKSMVRLQDVVLSREAWDRVESAVDEALAKRLWVDVSSHSISATTENDLRQITQLLKKKHQSEWTLCGDTVFYKAADLVAACGRTFESRITEKAGKEAPNVMKLLRQQQNTAPQQQQQSKKPSRPGKKRGGKASKRGGDDDDSDGEQSQSQAAADIIEFMTVRQIIDALRKDETLRQEYALETCPEELLSEVADQLRPTLNMKYRQQLETVFLASSNASEQQEGNQTAGGGKKSHAEFEETFRRLYQNICLFDADASAQFSETTAEHLHAHLLRTLCNELTNLAVSYFSRNANIQNAELMSVKVRDATIDDMPGVAREAFKKLVSSLNAKALGPFYDAVDSVSAPDVCSLKQIRTPDKRVRTTQCETYRQELKRQLTNCESDPASGLLISCILLLAQSTDQAMIHASGKFVPQLISCLKDRTPPEIYALLCETQSAVVQQLKNKDDASFASRALEKFHELKSAILK